MQVCALGTRLPAEWSLTPGWQGVCSSFKNVQDDFQQVVFTSREAILKNRYLILSSLAGGFF